MWNNDIGIFFHELMSTYQNGGMCPLLVFSHVCLSSENIFDEDNCVMVKKYSSMHSLELIKDVGMFFMLKLKHIGPFCKNL